MQSNNTKIDFNNLEVAFKGKSSAQLRQAHLLFRVMNSTPMVNMGKFMVNLAFKIRFPVQGIIRNTIYKHFVGGTSIADCAKTINTLHTRGVGTILDYAMEGEGSEEIFNHTRDEVIRTIELAYTNEAVPFSAFKITGIGRFDLLAKVSANETLTPEEQAELERVNRRVNAIFRRGCELGVPIFIDAEHSWIQLYVDNITMEMMQKYNKEKPIVQNTYQMYRHDAFDRLKQHHQMAINGGFKFGLKIVRGAYMEIERERAERLGYEDPIQPDKAATDRDFDAVIHYFFDHLDTMDLMVSTHNEESSLLFAELIRKHGLAPNHPQASFSQLYGMSDNITFNLAAEGYNVVKYVPYGEVKTMMPYLFRRAEENTSVKGQSSRELTLISTEIKRRKKTR